MNILVNLPAYAYEVQPGDLVDDRVVVSVEDDGETATVTFSEGEPLAVPRRTELAIRREWEPPPPPEEPEW